MKKWVPAGLVAAAIVVIPLLAIPFAALGLSLVSITSTGPLDEIIISDELNCQVGHTADSLYEFFPPANSLGACATQVHVGGTTYGPSTIPAGNSPVPFTPVSQTMPDATTIVTVVDVGQTGLRVTETDSYTVGGESYRTDVAIENTSGSAQDVIVYRAGDCFLQGSDFGFGAVDFATGAVSCVGSDDGGATPGSRIEQWFPLTPGSNYYEARFNEVWALVDAGTPFPNTTRSTQFIDNGAGLSWSLTIPAGETRTVSHLTVFSPQGLEPLTMAKTADAPTTTAGGSNGYTITITNPNVSPVNLSSVTDTLPAGFSYVAGSTTGATTINPSITGQELTWFGPIAVPANSAVTIGFEVRVAADPGTYFNEADADAGVATVVPTGPTAPIEVEPAPVGPPDVSAGADTGGPEGSAIALNGSATGDDPITYQWTVDDPARCAFADAAAAVTTITCDDDGTYTATLSATNDGGSSSDDAVVTVTNVAPTITSISAPGEADVGETVSVSAAFTDPGSNDTHTCSISWGDGTVSPNAAGTTSPCNGQHAYAGGGGYTITVTVSDDDGGTAVDTVPIAVDQPMPPPASCPNGDAADVVVHFPPTMKLYRGGTVERSVPAVVPAGTYRVILGTGDVDRGPQIQDHEQWRAELGGVATGFSNDVPDDPLVDVVGDVTRLPGVITVPAGVTQVTAQHWSTQPGNVDDTNPANSVVPNYLCLIRSAATNTPPVLGPIGDRMVGQRAQLSFTASASDPDRPAQTLTFSLDEAPAGATIDPATGAFTWTPSVDQGPGGYRVTIRVTDSGSPNLADTETITVTVTEGPPLLCPSGDAADVVVDFPATMKLWLGDTVERTVPAAVPAGTYRVILGTSDVDRGGQVQDHEQWRARLGTVTTGFSDDLPDDPLVDVVGHVTRLPGTITVPTGVTEVTAQHWSTQPGNVDRTKPANSVIPDYLCLIETG